MSVGLGYPPKVSGLYQQGKGGLTFKVKDKNLNVAEFGCYSKPNWGSNFATVPRYSPKGEYISNVDKVSQTSP